MIKRGCKKRKGFLRPLFVGDRKNVQNMSISRQQVFVVGYPTAYRGTSRAKLADSIKRIFLKRISKKMFFY